MPDLTYIYVLRDPDTQTPRYVGKTNSPKFRLAAHLSLCKKQGTKVSRWIYSLVCNNKKPTLEIIEEIKEHYSDELAFEREEYWIGYFSQNNKLLNERHYTGKLPTAKTICNNYTIVNKTATLPNISSNTNLKSATEAAALLGLERSVVFRHHKAGKLKAIKIGERWFVELDEIERFKATPRRRGPKGKRMK